MLQSRLTLLCLLPTLLLANIMQAQAKNQKPCTAPEFRQLDFWVGQWDLTWPGKKPGETMHAKNTVRRILDGCAIQEQFDGETATPLRGTSLSVYNQRLQKWQQTWVDNQGAYIDLDGQFADGQMTLSRTTKLKDGSEAVQRMVFKNIGPDSFDWSWEQSKDGGKTWQVQWPIHYQRKHS